MGSSWAKYILFVLKKYREVILHKTEEGYKIWRGIGLLFQNWHKEFGKVSPEHSKVSKIFTLRGSFWANYILFELKKYRGVIFHETEEIRNLKRNWLVVSKLTLRIWQILMWTLESLKNFHLNGLLLSKLYILWAEKVQRSYLSWN